MTDDSKVMDEWDSFLLEYNDFAIQHDSRCTFNQTKVLTRIHTQRVLSVSAGSASVKRAASGTPVRRLLSPYFARLLGEEPSPPLREG